MWHTWMVGSRGWEDHQGCGPGSCGLSAVLPLAFCKPHFLLHVRSCFLFVCTMTAAPASEPAQCFSCAPSLTAGTLLSVRDGGAGGGWLIFVCIFLLPYHCQLKPPFTVFACGACCLLPASGSCLLMFSRFSFAKNVWWRLVELLCWNSRRGPRG